jgi:predicted transcriptional regulator
MPQQFNSVIEMVRALSDNEAFVQSLEKKINGRKIIDQLMAWRIKKGITQVALAKKMRCSQSKIAKLENMDDNNVRLRDLKKYANALGLEIKITIGS